MPTTCVVGGCSNTVEDGFSLHTFPKDEPTKRLWIKFVQTTRADFLRPSNTSVICSAHFADDCYDPSVFLKEQFGIKGRRKVLPGKYPTIKSAHTLQRTHLPPLTTTAAVCTTTTTTTTSVTTSAMTDTCTTFPVTTTPTAQATSMPSTSSISDDEPRPAKRLRFTERRDKEQMIQELVRCHTEESVEEPPDVPVQEESEFEESFTRRSHWTRACQTELTLMPAKVKKRSKRVQCYPQLRDKVTQTSDASDGDVVQHSQQNAEVQCSLDIDQPSVSNQPAEQFLEPSASVQLPTEQEGEEEDEPEDEPEEPANGDYVPSDRSSTDSDRDSNVTDEVKIWEEEKFIVFRSSLLSLFTLCPNCYQITEATINNVIGTLVSIKQTCIACSWERTWNSQPFIKNTPAGNILLSAAILYAGASPTKTLCVLNHMGCKTHHLRTYFMHQSTFLIPTTVQVWEKKQQLIISELIQADRPLVLGGDARADSPGHTAKFSSYTLMELNTNKILNIELIQKNEVSSSSNAMELEGFKRTMTWMLETAVAASLDIDCIITDRHLQVAKWIRENLTQHQIKHYFDVWHVSKSLKKKVAAIGKKKNCEVVNEWTKSILNHLYWSASSTPDGNPDLMLEKFLSVTNHIQNIHTHDGPLFRECAHPPLAGERPRKWLKPGTEPCERLTDLCTATRLKNDVKKLSPKKQTSRIEAFHALLNFFAPKLTVFSYEGMTARVLLAGLHYNENCNRDVATTEAGEIVYSIDFPRGKSGDYSLRTRPTAASYNYVDDLMEETVRAVELGVDLAGIRALKTIPPPLTSGFTKPTLEEALQRQKSRFAAEESTTEPAASSDGAHASSSS